MPRRPFRNADGRLYKHLDIKLIIGDKIEKKRHNAPHGLGYTENDIRNACDQVIEHLEKNYPGVEFREVQIAANAFNYIGAMKPIDSINKP